MHHKLVTEIYLVMHPYYAKGKPSQYKKKQMKRLIVILDDIFLHEKDVQNRFDRIGRRHIIGYYRRHSSENFKTMTEKYSILSKFFSFYNPGVRVPKPDARKCALDIAIS